MVQEKGSISISTEDIFPIIKKWLYSEKDIFIRELVSNGADAINKLLRLAGIGEAEVADNNHPKIVVTVDKDAKTLTFEDNGIGMTADEVKKYINQIAFSGAKDFLEKYKDNATDAQIIGHFGLGFYSAFMVSETVTIETLSYLAGSEAVKWESDGSSGFTMEQSNRTERGTAITLHLNEEGMEYTDIFAVKACLLKYFSFLPVDLYVRKPEDPEADAVIVVPEDEEEAKKAPKPLEPLNEREPLWARQPQNCSAEDYKAFYHSVFSDFKEPLFWIHLNIDYPFRMKGILYFPKLRNEMGNMEGEVKLYCNQVFVADNIKEVIPEYLLLLKGCIDCPDLPLNVSRSFLQNDGTVTKLQSHITRKVSDKLSSLFELERENYCKYWDDIHPFVKFGCIRDDKFYEKMEKALLFKNCGGEYLTVDEYLEKAVVETESDVDMQDNAASEDNSKPTPTEKKLVYYTSDPDAQSQYVSLFKKHDINPVILDHIIDSPFISFLESKKHDVKFTRIDSDLSKFAGESVSAENFEKLIKKIDDKVKVVTQDMGEDGPAAVMLLSEQQRRMQEMMKQWGGGMDMPEMDSERTLVFNSAHPLVKRISEDGADEEAELISGQLYDIALLGFRTMKPEEMARFVDRSVEILKRLS